MLKARLRLLEQKIKQHPVIAVLVFVGSVLGIAMIVVVILGYCLNWHWTGLVSETSEPKQHAKTLWDWLQLLAALAIPAVVGFGTVWFTAQQAKESEAKATQQARESEANREMRHQTDLEIAEKNRETQQQTDLQIASDNQREAVLQAYLDKISELLLQEDLSGRTIDGKLKPEREEVRQIARVRTLAALRRLDADRKGIVLQSLYEVGLINSDRDNVVILMQGADLNGAKLNRIFLNGVNLSRVDLNEAILYRALLTNAILEFADLRGANIREADLIRCDLSNADLTQADLSGAILTGAMLINANLRGAIGTTPEQLQEARSLKGATMPDGSIHP